MSRSLATLAPAAGAETLALLRVAPAAHAEHVENHDRDADRNRRIGDVERPETMRAPVDVDEVDDRTGHEAIDQVAGGAADDQREAQPRRDLMMREARGIDADPDQGRGRNQRDDDGLERELDAVEEPKRGAAVEHMGEIHEARN